MKFFTLNTLKTILIFLIGALIGVSGFWLAIQYSTELRHFLLEKAILNLPQAKIAKFVQAIVQEDKTTALQLWEISGDLPDAKESALWKRREQVIDDLISAKVDPDYLIFDTEWWGTCCEPHVIRDSRGAGGSRIRVQFIDKNGLPFHYFFDIFTREQPYWGSATGYPRRDWVIRDVYPYEQKPMYWLLIYEPKIHSVQPPKE